MAHFVTLNDLSSEETIPNRRPLPNPWSNAKRSDHDSIDSSASFTSGEVRGTYRFELYGMDGRIRNFTSNEAPNRGRLIMMNCFPCFPLSLPGDLSHIIRFGSKMDLIF